MQRVTVVTLWCWDELGNCPIVTLCKHKELLSQATTATNNHIEIDKMIDEDIDQMAMIMFNQCPKSMSCRYPHNIK